MLVQAVQNTPTDKHTGKVQFIFIILVLGDTIHMISCWVKSRKESPLQALLVPVLDVNAGL